MKLSHLYLLFGFGLATCAFTACENVDEDERFDDSVSIENILANTKKNVLVEDFTGQRCVNCPEAANEVHTMQSLCGKERVVSVAIHGGSLGVSEDQSPLGLANATGIAYHEHWGVQSWPKGLVDRAGGLKDYDQWMASAITRFVTPLKVDLAAETTYDPATRKLHVKADVTGLAQANGKLQVWLTESDIVALQYTTSGSDRDYVHNHVFRASLNDPFGDELSVGEGDTQTREYDIELKEKWVADNLSVVVFFYNDEDGVMQVIDREI